MKTVHYTTFKAPITEVSWINNTSLAISNKDGPSGVLAFVHTEEANKFIMNNLEFSNVVTVVFNEGYPPIERVNPAAYGHSLVGLPLIPAYWHQPIPIYTLDTLPHKKIAATEVPTIVQKEVSHA
jgi:hypothetical protein